MTCHASCFQCSGQLFNECLQCIPQMLLSKGICLCTQAWQSECVGEHSVRGLVEVITMLIQIVMVAVMLLYTFKANLPISYRIWSGLNALSFLFYTEVFHLFYEEEYLLQSMAVSNGPVLVSRRVMDVSNSHIFPTLVILIVLLALLLIGYHPFQIFNGPSSNIFDYFKDKGLQLLDSAYFLCCRMMFFFIGKLVASKDSLPISSIIVAAIYGVFLLGCVGRSIYQYHKGTLHEFAYSGPIQLYTILSPISLVGLPLVSSKILYVIVYCSPFALLILILLLNRNMNILSIPNIKFYITEVLMTIFIMVYLFIKQSYRAYVLIAISMLCIIAVVVEVFFLNRGGYSFATVVPLDKEEAPSLPKSPAHSNRSKDGYF